MQVVRKRSLRWIEWLLSVAGITIFLASLMSAVIEKLVQMGKGKMTGIMPDGRRIYMAVFAKDSSDYEALPTNGIASSTAYFNDLMAHGVLDVKASFFCGPGMKPSPGTNLTASGNAWNVTLGFNDATPDGTPFLFTRNLAISALPGGRCDTPLTDDGSGLTFAKKGLVVVAKGGSAFILKPEQIVANFTTSARMTNLVARP